MLLKTRAYLRDNWLALLIIIAIFWGRIFDLLIPPRLEWNSTLINVEYWSLFTKSSLQPYAVLGFFCIAIVAGLLTYFYLVPYWKTRYRLILLIAAFSICALSTYTSHSIRILGSQTINHIMSVPYQGKIYHLGYYQPVTFLSPNSSLLYVFECDALDDTCSKIYQSAGELSGKLIVSDDKLILEQDIQQIQILSTSK